MYYENKKVNMRHVFLNLFLIIIGLILGLLALGSFNIEILKSFLVASIAASLIAAGIASLLTFWIIAPHSARQLVDTIQETFGSPARILPERRLINEQYSKLIESSSRIDITSLSLFSIRDNYSADTIIKWLKQDGKKIRLLVLSPISSSSRLRSMEEQINVGKKALESLTIFKSICDCAERYIEKNDIWKGSLEVRIYDGIPYFAYFRADNSIIVGFYFSNITGNQSEAMLIKKGDGAIFDKMENHFNTLWDNVAHRRVSPEESLICIISDSKVEFNQQLIKKLNEAIS